MSLNSNIIKQPALTANARVRRRVFKREVVEATSEAQEIVDAAQREAASIRLEAETAAVQLRLTAYTEGRAEALLELNEHLLGAREVRDTALAEAERDLLRLAITIAEKIIGHEIERNSTTLADIIANALRHTRQNEMLTVRIHPADLPLVEVQRERLNQMSRARFLDFVPDPRVSRGGCIIESESGTVDAQLATQLQVLERALLARASADNR
jgi:type III secretion system HrpE/YscL family protein